MSMRSWILVGVALTLGMVSATTRASGGEILHKWWTYDGSGEPGGFCWETRCKMSEPCCIIVSPT